ncbi:carbohydrate ABC transporter permease [Jiangella aurantiaca]|uniref:Carbohydrate ABC transporter permease n=1 Tax=Jiangella aurantiaca TaxID=2530373 RepID=A0A4R5A0L9_9ACTN|nr:carbohydrate ABC transporter permease [Jiangella aurantiaca]TDD64945.1 carbohydrate ABC transporter permease [Jiangella aurantiaca]
MTARTVSRQALTHLALALGGVVMLLPFAIMLWTAFVPERLIFGGAGLGDLTFENFRLAVREWDWVRAYRTSVVVAAITFVSQLLTCLPAGYVLARHRFRGRNVALWVMFGCLIVPSLVIAIPTYVMISRVGQLDTIAALVWPSLTSAFGIFLFRQFILTLPQSIFDAARLDRVGEFGMVWRVVLPNVRPAITAFGIFSVVSSWNDLFWASVVLQSPANATVPFAITQFADQEAGVRYGAQMAAATLAVAPLIIAFLVAQRQFVRGISLNVAD